MEIRFALSWGLEEARWGKEHPLLIFQKEGCSLNSEGTLGGGRQSWDRPSSARRVFLVGKVGTLAPDERLLMQGKSWMSFCRPASTLKTALCVRRPGSA